jgi:hypothetical protein
MQRGMRTTIRSGNGKAGNGRRFADGARFVIGYHSNRKGVGILPLGFVFISNPATF